MMLKCGMGECSADTPVREKLRSDREVRDKEPAR
jgi:hypothetical protein